MSENAQPFSAPVPRTASAGSRSPAGEPPAPSPETFPAVAAPDLAARRAAADRLESLALPRDGFGVLAELGGWLAAVQGSAPPRPPARVRVLVVAADHGIAEACVSAHPAGSTGIQVAAVRSGTAPVAVAAAEVGASVRVADVGLVGPGAPGEGDLGVRRGSGRIDREDALTAAEVTAALRVGRELADAEVDAGTDLLVPASLGVGATTPAAAVVSVVTGAEPVAVVGRGSGIDDATWMRKAAAIRDARRRAKAHARDPLALLRVAGGADLAVLTGFLAQAAVRRTPVLLDGPVVGAAALLAEELAPGARAWWLAAQVSPEPAMTLVLQRLELVPVLDLRVRLGDGTGAVAVLPLLALAARLLTEAAVADAGGLDARHEGTTVPAASSAGPAGENSGAGTARPAEPRVTAREPGEDPPVESDGEQGATAG